MLLPAGAAALPLTHYADNSALSQGNWMKIRVDTDGLYRIPTATLRSWGFRDLSRVRVFGYGGARISNVLSAEEYIDDLPLAPCELTDRGLVFYGVAGGDWQTVQGYRHYDQNPYSSYGYYFVGELPDADSSGTLPSSGTASVSENPARTADALLHHERELALAAEAGPLMTGEDFRYTRTRSFPMDFTDAADGGSARIEYSFISNLSSSGRLTANFDDVNIGSATISAKPSDGYVHGVETIGRHTFECKDGRHSIELTFTPGGTVSMASLNYISVAYERMLRMPASGWFRFSSLSSEFALANARDDMRIWEITRPEKASEIKYTISGGEAFWSMENRSDRTFVAWLPEAALPAPKTVGTVSNQNLHAGEGAEMIIICPSEFSTEASRLADFHRTASDPLSVRIVDPQTIYNEFSSGAPDVSGLRKYLKMLYDRGVAGTGPSLRYVILMARTTLDNRRLSASAPSYPTLPAWMPSSSAASLSDNDGFCSDDFVAMLGDGSGADMRRDKLSVALGRIPVTSSDEASSIVDKIIQYAAGAHKTAWKQRFLFIADDGDAGEHLRQSEKMISEFEHSDRQQHLVRKVYVDNYELQGNVAVMARETMYRHLEEGVVWWNYIGHANETSWTGEGLLTYTDINNMYLRHWPFIYAATCDFLRLDSRRISGGELMYLERYGGAIGMISAVRPVFISANGRLTAAIGRALAKTGADGRSLTPGEIYRQAKNDIRDDNNEKPTSDENRLRYIFVGDPALPLAMPYNNVRVDSIKGAPLYGQGAQPTLAALERANISGTITAADGSELGDFEGVLMIDIFDAERTVTTKGRGEGRVANFEDIGERIYTGSTLIKDGRFSLDVAMPAELAQNFRPATMSLYAYSTVNNTEAVGLCRDFYVYGYDETVAPDDKAPVIESLVLNHSDFRSGDAVNDTPMLIAQLRDDVGINISSAGIGHQLTAIVDGTKTFTGLSDYYTPSADGSPSGVLNYPMSGLQPGPHTLTLRVWDTTGNPAEKTVDFTVVEGMAPKIYDVYSDANPASTTANFYLSHNQPDGNVTVTVTVYNLIGRPVWSGTSSGRSDMFLSVPVSWDLSDNAGRRVGRGIYLYRATITTDGQSYQTASRRIAVAAP